ncbi:outer membrane protein [Pseudochrobactrum lubricantis]|uniref:outer membrane protein n=1 Tax=Pseudochrobactrum lubricantis TaxID=558172 RepID=UPI0035D537B0
MKKIVALLAMTILSGQAFAADAIVSAPEPAPVQDYTTFNWSGAYIGAHAGYGWGKTRDVDHPKPADSPEKKLKGGLGGLQAGYNWQFDNNIVLGAEADVTFGAIKKNWDGTAINKDSPYYTRDKIGTHGTVRARLGYAADRFLPYVTGGLAWADVKHTLGCYDRSATLSGTGYACTTGSSGNKPAFNTEKSKTSVGYTVGAGLEYAVTDNWTVKGEYLFTDLGKNKVTIVDPNYPNAHSERNFKTRFNEVRIGVNYKF